MQQQITGFISIGLISLGIGLSYKTGLSRQSYIIPSPWNNGIKYASIPAGILFMIVSLLAFIDINSIPEWFVSSFTIISSIAILWFNFFPPKFLYPDWYRWIQKNHGDSWPLLRQEAAKDYEQWYQRTRTQEGLEDWVHEVRKRHGI